MMKRPIKGSNVVVTGGAGFIGSSVVKALVDEGAQVKIIDNFSSGVTANLKKVKNKVEIVRGDILNPKLLDVHFRRADAVFHQAAQLEITSSINDPGYDLTTNTLGTVNVLKAASRHRVKKVINASSACIYGQAKTKLATENHPTDPNWEYGVSKLAAEKYAQIIHAQTGLAITSLRYSIVYGPNEWYGRALTIFLKRVLDGKSLIVFGKGDQVRDFVYVGDVVRMNLECLRNPKSDNQAFNVSTGIPTTIASLAELIQKEVNPKILIEYEGIKEGETSKRINRMRLPQELQRMCLSPQKAKRLLGWQAETSVSTGVKQEWEWLTRNPSRWKKMSY